MAITRISSVWTRTELLEQLDLYKEALKALAFGKSYTIGSRQLTRLDIDDITAYLDYLEGELEKIENGAGPKFVQALRRNGANCWRRRRGAW